MHTHIPTHKHTQKCSLFTQECRDKITTSFIMIALMGLTKQFHFSFFKVFLFPPFLSKICITYTHARDDGWWSSPPPILGNHGFHEKQDKSEWRRYHNRACSNGKQTGEDPISLREREKEKDTPGKGVGDWEKEESEESKDQCCWEQICVLQWMRRQTRSFHNHRRGTGCGGVCGRWGGQKTKAWNGNPGQILEIRHTTLWRAQEAPAGQWPPSQSLMGFWVRLAEGQRHVGSSASSPLTPPIPPQHSGAFSHSPSY